MVSNCNVCPTVCLTVMATIVLHEGDSNVVSARITRDKQVSTETLLMNYKEDNGRMEDAIGNDGKKGQGRKHKEISGKLKKKHKERKME